MKQEYTKQHQLLIFMAAAKGLEFTKKYSAEKLWQDMIGDCMDYERRNDLKYVEEVAEEYFKDPDMQPEFLISIECSHRPALIREIITKEKVANQEIGQDRPAVSIEGAFEAGVEQGYYGARKEAYAEAVRVLITGEPPLKLVNLADVKIATA